MTENIVLPVYFKGENSILSNFYNSWIYDPIFDIWGSSVEQLYQYKCAVYNNYEDVATSIINIKFGHGMYLYIIIKI